MMEKFLEWKSNLEEMEKWEKGRVPRILYWRGWAGEIGWWWGWIEMMVDKDWWERLSVVIYYLAPSSS